MNMGVWINILLSNTFTLRHPKIFMIFHKVGYCIKVYLKARCHKNRWRLLFLMSSSYDQSADVMRSIIRYLHLVQKGIYIYIYICYISLGSVGYIMYNALQILFTYVNNITTKRVKCYLCIQ